MRLLFGDKQVFLNADTQLFPHHIDEHRLYDFSKPIAEVTRHPQNPSRWGLKNLGGETWAAIAGDGRSAIIDPGRSIPLKLNTRIQFGKVEGTIAGS